MGIVYRVEHVYTGQEHALKILNVHSDLSPEVVERFKREARAPSRIRSEHVVAITDADVLPEPEGTPFLVMELLDGTDLEHELRRQGKLAPREVVESFEQVAHVLDKAHAIGIVHRDLKPENLFLHRRADGSTILKVLDFGISKMMGAEGTDPSEGALTNPGSMMGTPLYMSPEQAHGDAEHIGPRSDMWSLGLVAIRLLTGEHYWRSRALGDMLAELIRDPLYPPSERWPWLPAAFDAWFLRSCDRSPSLRFSSMAEQVVELASALGERASGFVSIPPLAASGATKQEGSLGSELVVTPGEAPISVTRRPRLPLPARLRAVALGAPFVVACLAAIGYVVTSRHARMPRLAEGHPEGQPSSSPVASSELDKALLLASPSSTHAPPAAASALAAAPSASSGKLSWKRPNPGNPPKASASAAPPLPALHNPVAP